MSGYPGGRRVGLPPCRGGAAGHLGHPCVRLGRPEPRRYHSSRITNCFGALRVPTHPLSGKCLSSGLEPLPLQPRAPADGFAKKPPGPELSARARGRLRSRLVGSCHPTQPSGPASLGVGTASARSILAAGALCSGAGAQGRRSWGGAGVIAVFSVSAILSVRCLVSRVPRPAPRARVEPAASLRAPSGRRGWP